MLIIGLSGKKQSGKDSVFECAQKIIQMPIRKMAFADALYEEVSHITGTTEGFVRDNKPVFRLLLQAWGTNFRRELCDANYWVEKLLNKLYKLPANSVVFVTDVRFHNEANAIHSLGGKVLRLTRKCVENGDLHPSEVDLDSYTFDGYIDNNGTLKDLYINTLKVLKNIKKEYGII